jgi:hypothetical protein
MTTADWGHLIIAILAITNTFILTRHSGEISALKSEVIRLQRALADCIGKERK